MRTLLIGVLAIQLIVAPVILQSCCGGFGGGSDTYYDIDEMELTVLPISTSNTLEKFSQVDFRVSFEVTYTAMETVGGSALYACEPAPAICNQQVAAVSITSDQPFVTSSGTTPAGENLSFMFKVNAVGRSDDPVSDLISNPLLDEFIYFHSDEVLSTDQTHAFTFKITLDDGRSFTLVTDSLDFLQG